MNARAIWRGVLELGDHEVPVKFYSAVRDTRVHFRLLHERDGVPVRQAMVDPKNDEVVPFDETRRAWTTKKGSLVLLERAELAALQPEPSRCIEVLCFVTPSAIDPRWYDRPYYLGPDGSDKLYFSLARALAESEQEGLVRWVMRNREYIGVLHAYRDYPMVISLRGPAEVVPASALEPPRGRELSSRELGMARQLMDSMAADFQPQHYRDEYRARVLDMLERKRKGGKVRKRRSRPRAGQEDLTAALEASLQKTRKRA